MTLYGMMLYLIQPDTASSHRPAPLRPELMLKKTNKRAVGVGPFWCSCTSTLQIRSALFVPKLLRWAPIVPAIAVVVYPEMAHRTSILG